MARAERIQRILGENERSKRGKRVKTNGSSRRTSRYAAKKASKRA